VLEYDFTNSPGFWIMTAAHEYEQALNDELEPQGITYRQWQVLGFLALAGPLSQAELADRMRIEPPTLVGILDRMERDGWIRREPCLIDRRRKMIQPMEAAKPVWSQIVDCAKRVRARATHGMSATELATLRRLLDKVQINLQGQIPGREAG
jgi:MarR family transcriptional regulator for hemolysin